MHPLGNLPRGLLDYCWIQGSSDDPGNGGLCGGTHSPLPDSSPHTPSQRKDSSPHRGFPYVWRSWVPSGREALASSAQGSLWEPLDYVFFSEGQQNHRGYAEQLYCLTERRCQKHVYLQTSCRPAKQQPPAGCETAWQTRLRADLRSVLEPRTGTM